MKNNSKVGGGKREQRTDGKKQKNIQQDNSFKSKDIIANARDI